MRLATPLLTAGPILGTLAEVVEEERVDVAGVCDATQVEQVFRQWADNPRSRWKGPLLERSLVVFRGKRSTPYAAGSLHDFMHAKVTVADDTVFLGSFNLSRSGELNAENVLEIADARSPTGWRRSSTTCARAIRRRSSRARSVAGAAACRAPPEPSSPRGSRRHERRAAPRDRGEVATPSSP